MPEAIDIRHEDSSRLVVSAISMGVVIKQSKFEAGKDFYFKDGRIELKREYVSSGAGEPGNPFIGVATSKTVLGLDAYGQGHVSQSTAFAGTDFF
jgi:hypothetical protein